MSKILCNLHTHSTFCDGADTPEKTVTYAIEKGCKVLGFSSHAPSGVDGDYGFILPERIEEYCKEVKRLKEKYRDKIEIVLGIEQDYFSPYFSPEYEYVIGSVHYIKKNGKFIPMDIDYEQLKQGIDEEFGGDAYALAEHYFQTVADLPDRTKCQIIGHFDLLTKFNEEYLYIDEADKRYREYALEAVDRLLQKDMVFEINTGAMAKGRRTSPYPADFIIKHINEKKGRMMLSSDCHAKENLFACFDEIEKRLVTLGIKELWVLEKGEFKPVAL